MAHVCIRQGQGGGGADDPQDGDAGGGCYHGARHRARRRQVPLEWSCITVVGNQYCLRWTRPCSPGRAGRRQVQACRIISLWEYRPGRGIDAALRRLRTSACCGDQPASWLPATRSQACTARPTEEQCAGAACADDLHVLAQAWLDGTGGRPVSGGGTEAEDGVRARRGARRSERQERGAGLGQLLAVTVVSFKTVAQAEEQEERRNVCTTLGHCHYLADSCEQGPVSHHQGVAGTAPSLSEQRIIRVPSQG